MRPYVPGDDVRRIDWNVTARTGEPHVRVDLAERVLVTWLVLDASVSMQFGTADRRKADVAEGVAVADRAPGDAAWKPSRRRHVRRDRGSCHPAEAGPHRARRAAGCSAQRAACRRGRARRRSRAHWPARERSRVNARSSWSSPISAAIGVAQAAARARGAPRRRRGRDPRSSRAGAADVGSCISSIPRPGDSFASTHGAGACASGSRWLRRLSEVRSPARSRRSVCRHVVLSTSGDWLRPLVTFLRRSRS